MDILFILVILLFIIIFLLPLFFHFKFPEIRWNWDSIDLEDISFPKSFIWGTATAAHQVEGNCHNNWSEFEKGHKEDDTPNIKDFQLSGDACDHWNRYKQDIQLINNLGVTHYRFSVEWSKIEPKKGQLNQDAINHYSEVIDELILNGITPVITLHHFTHPIWFEDRGAFQKKENIQYFVSFSKTIFNLYSNRVRCWCTINEPGVFAVQGYFAGIFPPGKKNPKMTGKVLKNLLESHVQIYRGLKKQKNGKESKIGIVKNINQFDPWRRYLIFDWLFVLALNHVFNWSTIKFFKTGILKIRIPGLIWETHRNPKAVDSLDFFGLNYYSHNHIKFNPLKPQFSELKYYKDDMMTDMPYTIYPEGIYRAIKFVSQLNKPIIITENGVADKDDLFRSTYINRYIYAMKIAMSEGYDVIGYYYWSLMDNFEWAFGFDMKFGLYEVDFKTQKRKLREGSKSYIEIVNKNNG